VKRYANVRPGRSLLPDGKFPDVDIVLIRENTGGFYVGVEHFIQIGDDPHAVAEATDILTRENCQRISKYASEYAVATGRKKITVVHKANILKALTGLFLETVTTIAQKYEGRVKLEERIVDNCAMQLVLNPAQFDTILTTNMFGDILADETASKGIVNPTALLLAAAMMLEHCTLHALAAQLRAALAKTLANHATRTRDLGGPLSTSDYAQAVIANL